MHPPTLLITILGLASTALAAQTILDQSNSVEPQQLVFTSDVVQDARLRYVRNSGVCETTPGVNQMSGYIDLGTNMSMWFWFFEARNDPETAPFTLWLNGGPGCSSMIGLFQENGPCTVGSDNKTTWLNPYSWNNLSNIIYTDQPIGSGLSYGTIDVNSTWAASPVIWTAFQILFESEEFGEYQSREFILATESYGGHYGPEIVTYFNEQNAKINDGTIQGEPINVSALMINNGWYDPLINFESYVKFARDAPGYGQLQSDEVLAAMNESFYADEGCRDQLRKCYAAGQGEDSNEPCAIADIYCLNNVERPAAYGRDEYDLRQSNESASPFPPVYYESFLNDPTILRKIGAEVPSFSACSDEVAIDFLRTGDDSRSLLSELAALADSGMKILIWAGDADINCNWVGGHQCVFAMDWYGKERLHNTQFTNMTIDGKIVAAYKNVDNFSFARVYEAGHEVPAFQPEVSFEIFNQIIKMESLHSVP